MKKQSVITQCPFWDANYRVCQLSENGLFVPVNEHIAAYCRTVNHTSCAQYLNNKPSTDSKESSGKIGNRRHYDRVVGRYSFRITEFDRKHFATENIVDETAISIDFSIGGIRFETQRQLTPETLLRFTLNGEFSHTHLHGFGKVQWCKALGQSPYFYTGVAFVNSEESMQLKKQLLQVHE